MTRRYIILALFFFQTTLLYCQTFIDSTGGAIPSNNTETCFPITITGVGAINHTYGLSQVCINVMHPNDNDLIILLKAPDGTKVPLSIQRGQTGDNYINTCFAQNGTKAVSVGLAPFSGTFIPDGYLGTVNNGQNADGVWYLCIIDVNIPNAGRVVNFSLTFSNTPAPAPPAPLVQDCLGAMPLCSPAYTVATAYNGKGNYPNEINPDISCIKQGEKNSVWYTFSPKTSGNLSFLITPVIANEDYDWAVFDVTGNACGAIQWDVSRSLSCNYSASGGATGPTGGSTATSQSFTGTPYNATVPVASGKKYAVYVSHFTVSTGGFTINFGNSTAQLYDTTRPQLDSAGPGNNCGTNELVLRFSKPLLCSSLQKSDFVITGPKGNYAATALQSNCSGNSGNAFTLTVNPAMSDTGNYQVCLVNTSATTPDSCKTKVAGGCVSFMVAPAVTRSIEKVSVCTRQLPYLWNGNSYTTTGMYKDTLVNAAGCDSVMTLELNVHSSTFNRIDTSVCSNALPFAWQGQLYNTAGIYTDTILNAVGCDSVMVLHLNVKQLTISVTNVAVCSKQLPYTWNGHVYGAPGTYRDTITNTAGCDSLMVLNLQLLVSTSSTENIAVCSNQLPFNWNGGVYSSAGTYYDTLLNAQGCDSVITLNLTVRQQSHSTTNVSICNSQLPYLWNGGPYTSAGTYYDTILNAQGCDSIMVLNLIILSATSSINQVHICQDQVPYLWNGQSYSSSGVYRDTTINAQGCDSIMVLNLLVSQPSFSSSNVSVCNSQLPYVWNGHNYTTGGVYKDTIPNITGCDSIVTLNLQVGTVGSSTSTVTLCSDQLPYTWNGTNYSAAGTYTFHTNNTAGCDSTAILILGIKNSTALPVASSNSPVCAGAPLQLFADGGSAVDYNWTGPFGFASSKQNPVIDKADVRFSGSYSVTTADNGCKSRPVSINVIIIASPAVNAGKDLEVFAGDTIQLQPTVSGSNLHYQWSPTIYFNSFGNVKNPIIIPFQSITYYLTVTSSAGCITQDRLYVKVIPRKKLLNIPNVFSPNGDGINDFWDIRELLFYPEAMVDVFNRNGGKVFTSYGTTLMWDGTYNGNSLPIGTYYYIISLKGEKPISGSVTLLR